MPHVTLEYPLMLAALPLALLPLLLLRRRRLTPRATYGVVLLRVLAVALLITCLARPTLLARLTSNEPFGVTILRDVSDSMKPDAAARDAAISELTAKLPGPIPVEVLDFAVAAAPRGSVVDPSQTNIQAALDTTFARTADRPSGHVVVVSDGRENRGNAVRTARWFSARGGAVHTLAVGQSTFVPPRIVRVEPSVQNEVGKPIRFTMIVDSPVPQAINAALVSEDGVELDRRTIQVTGERAIVLTHTPTEPGIRQFHLKLLDPAGRPVDSVPASAFVNGPPCILVVDPFVDETELLKRAISPLKLRLDVCTPEKLPKSLGTYSAVILSDLSGSEFSADQRRQIRQAVEAGTGLLFIGGSNGVTTRWRKNEIAEVLPITFAPPKPSDKKKRELTVCYVLDRSGSMQESLDSTVSKLDLVKAAVHASLRDLPEEAKVAVVVFDSEANVVVPPTAVAERDHIDPLVDNISLGGGTDMATGVRAGLDILAQEPGEKYMVVLTDGETINKSPQVWDPYSHRTSRLGVNWTSIAVGTDADQAFMKGLATSAGGQYFYCGTAARIPKVFISQARQIAKQELEKREPFQPHAGKDVELIKGIPTGEFPELADAMDATSKPGSQSLLLGRDRMSLLASWRFGLGVVTAFTSTPKNDWAPEWVRWPKAPVFWCQLLQSCLRPPSELYAKVSVYEEGEQLVVVLDVKDGKAMPVSNMSCDVLITRTQDGAKSGEYESRSSRAGFYEVRLTPSPQEQTATIVLQGATASEVVRYPLTLRRRAMDESLRGADEAALKAIADSGNGVMSKSPSMIAGACIPPPSTQHERRTPLVPFLATLAILAWIADIALRKWCGS